MHAWFYIGLLALPDIVLACGLLLPRLHCLPTLSTAWGRFIQVRCPSSSCLGDDLVRQYRLSQKSSKNDMTGFTVFFFFRLFVVIGVPFISMAPGRYKIPPKSIRSIGFPCLERSIIRIIWSWYRERSKHVQDGPSPMHNEWCLSLFSSFMGTRSPPFHRQKQYP